MEKPTFNFAALSSARFRASVPKITGKSMPTGMSWDLILPPQRSEHSGNSQIGPPRPPSAGLLEYSSNHHSPFLCSLDSFKHLTGSRGLPPQNLLCLCKGVLESLVRATAEAEEGTWLGWALNAGGGVVRLLAGDKAAVNLPQGHTCLVRLASDVQSPGRTDFFLVS